jgi:GNAT superfamily N-acetyltransferase
MTADRADGAAAPHIRLARVGDESAVARVHISSWQRGYRGLLPDEYLASLRPEDRAPHYRFARHDRARTTAVAAGDAGSVDGFVTFGASRDAGAVSAEGEGEIMAIYVAPERWRGGVGGALMRFALDAMREAGFARATLWMLRGNDRADRFYRSAGWTPDGGERSEVVWGAHVDEVRYRIDLGSARPGSAGDA